MTVCISSCDHLSYSCGELSVGLPSRGWRADKKSSKLWSLVVSGRARYVQQRGQDLDMPSSAPYQTSTQLLQPTIFLQQRANMMGGGGSDWIFADVASECITQFTVEGNWDLCKSVYFKEVLRFFHALESPLLWGTLNRKWRFVPGWNEVLFRVRGTSFLRLMFLALSSVWSSMCTLFDGINLPWPKLPKTKS